MSDNTAIKGLEEYPMRNLIKSIGTISVLVGFLLLVVGCAAGVGTAASSTPPRPPTSPRGTPTPSRRCRSRTT